MTVLKLQTGEDNKVLRTKSEPVKKTDKKLLKLIADMKETLIANNGLGLAAPQIGVNIRLCVVRIEKMLIPMINPKIVEIGDEDVEAEEGCLSLPGRFLKILRKHGLVVKFQDIKGGEQILKLNGLHARILQHEIDHLDGILIVDRI